MVAPLEEVPVDALVVVPLAPLGDLVAHEQEFFAGVAAHVAVQQPEVGELLPEVAGHLVEQRALAVHDLVVRQRQDEVLGEGVDQAEGEPAVVVLAIDGVFVRSTASVSFIQPMFHFRLKPRPPR